MYRITGIKDYKIAPAGAIIRTPSTFVQILNTEAGVLRWIDEQQPFKKIEVMDLTTMKDVTAEFVK